MLIISIYASQDLNEKRMLWEFLGHLIDSWEGECVLLGDFNEMRLTNEIYGIEFNTHGANAFNNFISMVGLVDLPFEGYSHTWAHKSAFKMSKLDKFLISEGLLTLFPSLSALCLDRHLSDHRPILMRELNVDYGPTLFSKMTIQNSLSELDKLIDHGRGNEELVRERTILLKELHDLNSKSSLDLLQKAKIRWAIEDDENSKYFHDPFNAKEEFLNHISNKFADPIRLVVESHFPTVLSLDQISDLECILPPRFNSSFIAVIPKMQGAKVVKDFHPISLIDKQNVATVVNVLKCFFLASGLKINLHKSKLMDIGIPQEEAMYDIRGALDRSHSLPARNSPWIDIIREVKRLSLKESSGEFSMKSVCSFIDDSLLLKADVPTRWVKAVPIKINIFGWRVSLDKLPTRLNLSLRGVNIPSILCPLCSISVESSSHLLFSCHLARSLMHKVVRWWDLDVQDFNSYGDWLIWLNNIRLPSKLKEILEGTCYITWWVIWKYRNQFLFGSNTPCLELLFEDIVRLSYSWCSHRCRFNFDWNDWVKCPSYLSL
ncbi:RNA-directed DNA polymerase, eukaryota [Tanacetum coccineum]